MTKILKVLGSENCKKCKLLKENIDKIVKDNNFDVFVEKIDDIQIIIDYGVIALPAIVINEKVVSFGKVPNDKEIIELLNK